MMRVLLVTIIALALCACDSGIKQMGPTEYGVLFRKLPPALGGGVAKGVKFPGQMAVVLPWETIYKFDTSVQDINWGPASSRDDSAQDLESYANAPSPREHEGGESGYVHTRAADGNEVALAVTVRYKVTTDAQRLVRLVEQYATNAEEVRELVVSVARADIRTYMNKLRTAEYLDKDARYAAVDEVKRAMSEKLEQYGIEVLGVNLNDFRFERALADGTVDSSYQDRLKEIQKTREDTEREKQRIETVQAKKQAELNEAQGIVNRQLAEAEGAKNQAKFRGDAYFEARSNAAKGILAQGEAEVKGLIEKINALNGPGGQELLKLEIARQLLQGDPKFLVLNEGAQSQSMQVNRTDTNQLLTQLGLLDAMRSDAKEKSAERGELPTKENSKQEEK